MASWYVIRSKPRKESLLFHQLHAHGIEVFFPEIKVKPVNPRASKTQAYFPGYMFVRVDLPRVGFSLLNWMPYSLGLVSFGGEIPRVSDELIHLIRKQADTCEVKSPTAVLKHGDLVAIERGPFAGYKAIFDTTLCGTERARVLLKLLQNKRLPIDLPVNYLDLRQG
jgi:transcriptional antiterminator RfaH